MEDFASPNKRAIVFKMSAEFIEAAVLNRSC